MAVVKPTPADWSRMLNVLRSEWNTAEFAHPCFSAQCARIIFERFFRVAGTSVVEIDMNGRVAGQVPGGSEVTAVVPLGDGKFLAAGFGFCSAYNGRAWQSIPIEDEIYDE